MENIIQGLLDDYIRKTLKPFTVADISRYLQQKKQVCSLKYLEDYLDSNANIFQDSYGKYYSRPSLFTAKYFSFVPTKQEVDGGYLIVGHRTMPFTDPKFLPNELHFFFCGDLLPTKVIEVNTYDILPLYSYYGEEYVDQVIASDNANDELDLSACEFQLPSKVNLTVIDFSQQFEKFGFRYGDRIIGLVSDWDHGFVNIAPFCRKRKNLFEESTVDLKRDMWEKSFERALIRSFNSFGPGSSIEEQLAFAFASDGNNRFNVPFCSSVEEVLNKSDKIELTEYGVETRLWEVGKEIPAFINQAVFSMPVMDNDSQKNQKISENTGNSENFDKKSENISKNARFKETLSGIFDRIGVVVPDWIVDGYLIDSISNKEEKLENIVKNLIPELISLKSDEYGAILLHLERKRAIIREKYNWFADYKLTKIRHMALNLHTRLINMFYEIDNARVDIKELSQQNLVILTQLASHISSLVYLLNKPENISEKEYNAISASIEGMLLSFDESSAIIKEDLVEHQKRNLGLKLRTEE